MHVFFFFLHMDNSIEDFKPLSDGFSHIFWVTYHYTDNSKSEIQNQGQLFFLKINQKLQYFCSITRTRMSKTEILHSTFEENVRMNKRI